MYDKFAAFQRILRVVLRKEDQMDVKTFRTLENVIQKKIYLNLHLEKIKEILTFFGRENSTKSYNFARVTLGSINSE